MSNLTDLTDYITSSFQQFFHQFSNICSNLGYHTILDSELLSGDTSYRYEKTVFIAISEHVLTPTPYYVLDCKITYSVGSSSVFEASVLQALINRTPGLKLDGTWQRSQPQEGWEVWEATLHWYHPSLCLDSKLDDILHVFTLQNVIVGN